MSEHLKLGEIIAPERAAERDAVHVAVVPVTAGERLIPGSRVRVENGRAFVAKSSAVGVADPFLSVAVMTGQRFWLYLQPGSITSLRHEWEHPSFPLEPLRVQSEEREASEKWLREFADVYRIDYRDLVEGAETGDGGTFGMDTPYDEVRSAEFWQHIENVTGKRFDDAHRENTYFGCAC